VEARALIASKRREPCPLAVVAALLDRDERVSEAADTCAGLFQHFPPGSLELLLRYAEIVEADKRDPLTLIAANIGPHDPITLIARAGGKDPRGLAVIHRALRHDRFQVRHNARVALFEATDDFVPFLRYLVRLQEDQAGILGPVDEKSWEGRTQETSYHLARLGSVFRIIDWADSRPEDLARGLVALLDDSSPAIRRGAARLIGANAHTPGYNLHDPQWKRDVTKLLAEWPFTPKVSPIRTASKMIPFLAALHAESRLRRLAAGDPCPTVRENARNAVKRLVGVQRSPVSP
jgi:hypothetical protein